VLAEVDGQSVDRFRLFGRADVPRPEVLTLQRSIAGHLTDQEDVFSVRIPRLERHAKGPEACPAILHRSRKGRPTVQAVECHAGESEPVADIAALQHQNITPRRVPAPAVAPAPADQQVGMGEPQLGKASLHRLAVFALVLGGLV
jgi:hypothetical protein